MSFKKNMEQYWKGIEQSWERTKVVSLKTKLSLYELFNSKIKNIKSRLKWYFAYKEFMKLYKLAKTDPMTFFNTIWRNEFSKKLDKDINILIYLWNNKNIYYKNIGELRKIAHDIDDLRSEILRLYKQNNKNISKVDEIKKIWKEKYNKFTDFYEELLKLYKDYRKDFDFRKRYKILEYLIDNEKFYVDPDFNIVFFLSYEKDSGDFWANVNNYLKKVFKVRDINYELKNYVNDKYITMTDEGINHVIDKLFEINK